MPNYGKCQRCGGEKKIPCTICKATGQLAKSREWCNTCFKTGQRPCPECAGTTFPKIKYYVVK